MIVDSQGKPLPPTAPKDEVCPGCQQKSPKGDERARRLSGGFGAVHDVCRKCGHDFEELTVSRTGKA